MKNTELRKHLEKVNLMKRIITLFSAPDNNSYFKEVDPGVETEEPLGSYSKNFPVKNMRFRFFKADMLFDWHPAPQAQYIIYQEGNVEVEASGGEKRVFGPGDVLFATDLDGKGHITRTLTDGCSIIVTAREDVTEVEPGLKQTVF